MSQLTRNLTTIIATVCISLTTTGCWDRVELNERAFVLATGLDESDQGDIIESIQIASPALLGQSTGGVASGANAFAYQEADGVSVEDAKEKLQAKVSRRIFAGHRRAIFIGEKLAKHGVQNVLDEFSRNPEVRLRTDIFVVRGGEAREALQKEYPFERLPTIAALKTHHTLGGYGADLTFRDFLMDLAMDGEGAALPAVTGVNFAGRAVFDKSLKLVGYLNDDESIVRLWAIGGLRYLTKTVYVPEGKGYVSMNITHLKSKIVPTLKNGHLSVDITLVGYGDIRESEANMNLLETEQVNRVTKLIEDELVANTEQVVAKCQHEFKTDIFHFAQATHERYPKQFATLKRDWQPVFCNADVHVQVKLTARRTGLSGSPLQLIQSGMVGQ